MRLYWEVGRRAFRQQAAYRELDIAGILTQTVFGFLRGYVLLAVYRTNTDVGGFDATDVITFTFVSQGFLMMTAVFGTDDVAARVRTGDIVTDLYRPVDFQGYWLANDLGRAAFHFLVRGVPVVAFGALVFDFRLATDPVALLGAAMSIVAAIVISFGLRFLINLTAFWLLDIRGLAQMVVTVHLFFAGVAIPLTFFPAGLAELARALPFAGMIQVPVEVLMGKHTGARAGRRPHVAAGVGRRAPGWRSSRRRRRDAQGRDPGWLNASSTSPGSTGTWWAPASAATCSTAPRSSSSCSASSSSASSTSSSS